MTTPNIRTALKRLVELDKRIEDVIPGIEIDNWIDAMDAARAALKPDDMPPAPLSEDDLRQRWNQQADEYNQWESLDFCEQLAWAQALAIRADRHAAALKAKPEGQRPTDEDLYDLAEQFKGDPVSAIRHALELWGNPPQGAPATGENPATPPAPQAGEVEALVPVGERLAGDVATDDEIQEKFRQSPGTIAEGWRGIYNMGYEHGAATFPEPKPENIVLLAGGIEEIADFLFELEKYDWYATLNRASKHLQRLNRAAQSFQVPATEAGVPVAELDAQHREAVHQAVVEALGSGAYDCQRVWEAWDVGTMGPDDFVPLAEDDDRVAEIADAAIRAISTPAPVPAPPAPQPGDVALAGDRRSAESLQLAHESCRLFGTKNGDCPDSEICWLDLLPCSHYENCATIPASQSGEGEA